MESPKTVKPARVYASGNPAETFARYGCWRFWKEDGLSLDFAASPSVNTFKQAKKLVNKYYPDAEVINGRPQKAGN